EQGGAVMMRWMVASLLLAGVGEAAGGEAYTLRGTGGRGGQNRVRCREELKGGVLPPAVEGKKQKGGELKGGGAIDYDEKVLAVDKEGRATRTVRKYRKLDIKRTLAGQPQSVSLRAGVRRLVILRKGSQEVPFSPDGPLLWAEIDAVRTDVFTPA